ncbi:MAG: galactose mutarotase [Fimbriimonadaceae bacterium]|nr:galactose mutarotase [Fimbriimonadaceae bacterium]
MTFEPTPFGTLPDGRPATLYTLDNGRGLRASLTDYGATLVDLQTPDRDGKWGSVVLGYPDLAGYIDGKWYLGAVCGRFANRIAGGAFTLDGRRHQLSVNEGANHLHGGAQGIDRSLWRARHVRRDRVVFELTSPDGDQGYPGNLRVRVTYTLTPSNALRLEYWAATDKATPVNLTHHAYFNLAGAGPVGEHRLAVRASRYLRTGEGSIPTGETLPTRGTPFDLGHGTTLRERMASDHPEVRAVGGIDHCYVLDLRRFGLAAVLDDPASGRVMRVFTDLPGLQVYTGNFLDGKLFPRHGAVCLETQRFPDSPNHAHFPDTVLRPGQKFRSVTEYRFSLGAGR